MNTPPDTSMVWYACYGSNLHRPRFECYIAGGKAIGSGHQNIGCSDKTLPAADAAISLPFSLYFAGNSKVWSGGLAFITKKSSRDHTKGRAYLITAEQFEEIVAQENGRTVSHPIDWSVLRRQGYITTSGKHGNYDKILYCGDRDGLPVVSFTSSIDQVSYSPPAKSYMRTIGLGLIETHSMTPRQVSHYLSETPGVKGHYTIEELIETMELQHILL